MGASKGQGCRNWGWGYTFLEGLGFRLFRLFRVQELGSLRLSLLVLLRFYCYSDCHSRLRGSNHAGGPLVTTRILSEPQPTRAGSLLQAAPRRVASTGRQIQHGLSRAHRHSRNRTTRGRRAGSARDEAVWHDGDRRQLRAFF